jgi:glycosyltransferase involved in cell wall biosynthesis
MRLLFVSPGYPGLDAVDSGSGIGSYVQQMAQGLLERGHECQVLTWSRRGQNGSCDVDGVRVHYEGRRVWPVLDRWSPEGRNVAVRAWAARRLDRRTPFDWIEIQNDEGVDVGIQRVLPHKTVLRVHTTLKQIIATKKVELNARRRTYLRLEEMSFRLAKRVITHSASHAAALRAMHPELCRPQIIPHGVGTTSDRCCSPPPALVLPRILVVGTLDLRKGTDRLAAALAECARVCGPVEVRFVSASPQSQLREFGLRPGELPQVTVTYRSSLSPDELAEEYRSATVLLHLARYESFGLPLIEAASWGLPVLATATGVAPELLTGRLASLVLDGDCPVDCARALREAIAGGCELRAATFESYAQRFTRTAMVDAFLGALDAWSPGKRPVVNRKDLSSSARPSLIGSNQ